MILTAKIHIELVDDAVEYKRTIGMRDTAIIHEICDEIQGKMSPHLTELGVLEFTDCEIKTEKEKVELPF